jgi:hypothetical protein
LPPAISPSAADAHSRRVSMPTLPSGPSRVSDLASTSRAARSRNRLGMSVMNVGVTERKIGFSVSTPVATTDQNTDAPAARARRYIAAVHSAAITRPVIWSAPQSNPNTRMTSAPYRICGNRSGLPHPL